MIRRFSIPLLLACGLVAAAEEADLDNPEVRAAIVKKARPEKEVKNPKEAYTGWAKSMHRNGTLAELCEYRDGRKHGTSFAWRPDGKKFWEGRFEEGRQIGSWTFFGAGGETTKREFTGREDDERKEGRQRRAGRYRLAPHLLAAFDADRDGKLDDEEIATFGKSREKRVTAKRAEALQKFDTDNDGKISFPEQIAPWDGNGDGQLNEVERATMRADKMRIHEAAREADRRKFDRNGDGEVSSKERIATYDQDGDGTLDEEEQLAMQLAFERGVLTEAWGKAEGGADQPATAPESEPHGKKRTKPESKRRPL